ncbi:MLO-like protein 13 [Aristolochia californica]|uniref:MLO-like protein 13 n=1 Tax=Aristolochia californica TaxID=171875 RepID=UPI0035DCF586
MATDSDSESVEYTPTWVVAVVCSVIVLISLLVERFLHRLGKVKSHFSLHNCMHFFQALQKLKEELMLLGFISLLLTVFQGVISNMCIPKHLSHILLPCSSLFSKVPMLSLEALHQLHIFIFVLAVVHVIFCATTMVLGGAKVELWKRWEDSIKKELLQQASGNAVQRPFFKQFYASVSQLDYSALRSGFIKKHCNTNPGYDFHKYLMRTLQADFKKVVGIIQTHILCSWYLWFFVVIFLLLNLVGWHTYFWLSFLPLFVSTHTPRVILNLKPSDQYFWFHRPGLVLYLIHFILFQNAFEIAFFFWTLSTYGFHSCIMEEVGYVVPRLIFGVIIQLLCSYSTLPLYVLVTQMGTMFKKEIFDELVH